MLFRSLFLGLFGFLTALVSPEQLEWDDDAEITQLRNTHKQRVSKVAPDCLIASTMPLPKVFFTWIQISFLKDSQVPPSIIDFSQQLRAPPISLS